MVSLAPEAKSGTSELRLMHFRKQGNYARYQQMSRRGEFSAISTEKRKVVNKEILGIGDMEGKSRVSKDKTLNR